MSISRAFGRFTGSISRALGTEPEATARATGNFLITAITDFVSDTFFTKLGSKLLNLILGIGMVAGSYKARDTVTKTDLYDLGLRFFRKALDGRPEDYAELAEEAKELGRRLGMLDMSGVAKLLFQMPEKLSIQFSELGRRLSAGLEELKGKLGGVTPTEVVAGGPSPSPELVPPPPPAPKEEKKAEEAVEARPEIVMPDKIHHLALVEV